jgi:DNA-binding XRE family transcriptional regulator
VSYRFARGIKPRRARPAPNTANEAGSGTPRRRSALKLSAIKGRHGASAVAKGLSARRNLALAPDRQEIPTCRQLRANGPFRRHKFLLHRSVFYIIYHFLVGNTNFAEGSTMSRADDLRALRLQKRLTQAEVADKFKVSQAYYSAIEAGRKHSEIAAAEQVVNRMRTRTDRTDGGGQKAGRQK